MVGGGSQCAQGADSHAAPSPHDVPNFEGQGTSSVGARITEGQARFGK